MYTVDITWVILIVLVSFLVGFISNAYIYFKKEQLENQESEIEKTDEMNPPYVLDFLEIEGSETTSKFFLRLNPREGFSVSEVDILTPLKEKYQLPKYIDIVKFEAFLQKTEFEPPMHKVYERISTILNEHKYRNFSIKKITLDPPFFIDTGTYLLNKEKKDFSYMGHILELRTDSGILKNVMREAHTLGAGKGNGLIYPYTQYLILTINKVPSGEI